MSRRRSNRERNNGKDLVPSVWYSAHVQLLFRHRVNITRMSERARVIRLSTIYVYVYVFLVYLLASLRSFLSCFASTHPFVCTKFSHFSSLSDSLWLCLKINLCALIFDVSSEDALLPHSTAKWASFTWFYIIFRRANLLRLLGSIAAASFGSSFLHCSHFSSMGN